MIRRYNLFFPATYKILVDCVSDGVGSSPMSCSPKAGQKFSFPADCGSYLGRDGEAQSGKRSLALCYEKSENHHPSSSSSSLSVPFSHLLLHLSLFLALPPARHIPYVASVLFILSLSGSF